MMDRVRTRERIIMKLCVEQCKMPKKNFVTLFAGNETSDSPVRSRAGDGQAMVGKAERRG